MKALHVIPAVAARYGGPSEAALRMVRALQGAGVEALLATTDADGPSRLPVATGELVEYEGARTVFFPRLPGESLKLSPSLAGWLRENAARFDVVHVHSVFSHASAAAGAAARAAGVPYVVRPLGQLDRWSLAQHPFRKRLFLAAWGQRLVEEAAAVHWTDPAERERCALPGEAPPGFVVPLGVDETLFDAPPGQQRGAVVLFLSRIHPKKNVEALLEAFASAGPVSTGWTLVIAGDGEPGYVASLKGLSTRLGVEGRVAFVGWVGGDGKRKAFGEASVFVLPSRQENFGVVVAEAMATGTPVVVSRDVALADEIERAGAGWVAASGVEGLRTALEEAMGSSQERGRRSAAARSLAGERFRWSGVARALRREYEAILRGRGRGGPG